MFNPSSTDDTIHNNNNNNININNINFGYQSCSVSGVIFNVPIFYHIIKPIGRGAFGMVVSALNRLRGQSVAIKKINNPFANVKDSKRTLREIKLLKHFHHENILDLIDIPLPLDRSSFKEIYLVTGLMETDLHQVIISTQELSDKHIQYFLYQILRGLKHIHSANVLHRDLKPSNLLVNGDCSLKICDFGMARVVPSSPLHSPGEIEKLPQMTEYVATRWYRAPEVILSWKYYNIAIDMWSVGCIFAELFMRKPFFPGKNYMHQITQIIDIIGSPTETDLLSVQNIAAREFIKGLGLKQSIPFPPLIPNAPPAALDLLSKMLAFNPERRITVQEALAHPYLAALHEPTEEPVAPPPFDFGFEDADLDEASYRELIYQEALTLQRNPINVSYPGMG